MTRFEIMTPVLQGELEKPYVYGESDCFFLGCQMADAFDASREMTFSYWRSYKTLAGAQRALRKRGHKSLKSFFGQHLEQVSPAQAQVGDIVVILIDNGEHVGICLGASGRFVTKTADGPSYHRVGECLAAFRT
ncbi:DUF6950 family protein [Brucella rhizosphaerae]|uniref:DUF6950 domain-containing protein n=2 Tax=Brucella rhizosphaerae TaxID=571254 RepID=A0A256FQJ3_9HYPH|nr:hypothetical protein [Brucella rhizosphaerae]OYR16711.1 hypothetical protein CEV32_4345 [Brucella rhizosphaerae]